MNDIVPVDGQERTSSALVRGASLIKDMGRLRQIASVAVKHGLGEVIERLNLQDSTIVSILAGGRDKGKTPPSSMPVRLRLVLQELGPTFVKLGQVLSTRPDLVPEEYIVELRRLQSDVPPAPLEEVRPAIELALGQPLSEAFVSFDENPVAAASVAQVYRGQLVSGEWVAVKVLRPGVQATVEADIGVMDLLSRRLEAAFPEARALNLSAMVREFERAMRREIDLRNEARNLGRFRTMFAGRADVRIPAVLADVSTGDVLVMEFLEGQKVTVAAAYLPQNRREALIRSCFDILFTMIFVERTFHGDLHPGNVFLEEDGAIALIDLGLVGRLTPAMRDQIVDVLLALSQGDWQAVAESFHDMAIRTRPVSTKAFAAEVADLMDGSIDGRTLSELEIGAVLARLGEIGVRFGMRVPSEYAMMIKAVLTVEGLGKALAPSVNPVEMAKPYVSEAIRERYAPERLGAEGLRTLLTLSRVARELPPTIQEMVSSVEGGKVRLGIDVRGGGDVGPVLKAAVAPVTDAVLAGGLVIAGAMALPHGEVLLLGLPSTSLVLFSLAALSLLRSVVRKRKS